jgi:hypothetical protein
MVVSKSCLAVHFAETLESLDLHALAGNFQDAGKDLRDREQWGGVLLITLSFQQVEERHVIRMENRMSMPASVRRAKSLAIAWDSWSS